MTSISAATTAQNVAASPAATSSLTADFNMFLNLLTTQMQNQDPLDPMDTSEYTQQLVQYSQVEQSIQQTSTLKDILSSLSTQDMAQAANFLGRQAEFDTPVAGLSADTPAQWRWQADRSVQSVTATISDASGRVVETRTLTPGKDGEFVWDGSLANGGKVAPGSYSLELQGLDSNGTSVPVTVHSVGTVGEVATVDGAVQLGVNGATLPASAMVRMVSQNG
ncbi:flagellar hook assembly protein FlgD [Stakelama marina]|uniref:Basal-body rod modification protein FlgD n=1 Tax=Stakelama marina TaxID=2826939 RepID=A0A8T4I9W8_9SPHN|nr:flagellar hook capping FlgD N-terminal domain-containing protein [Stakelama marina]MBR0550932.1 flagellar hook assembly protein FlgD [Stakelama marina]